jgi:hypothetical protein
MAATLAGADTVGTALTSDSPAATIAPSTIERIPSSLSTHDANLADHHPVAIWIPYSGRRIQPAIAAAALHRNGLPEPALARGSEPERTAIGCARKQTKVARLARVSAHEFIRTVGGSIGCESGVRIAPGYQRGGEQLDRATPPTSHAH